MPPGLGSLCRTHSTSCLGCCGCSTSRVLIYTGEISLRGWQLRCHQLRRIYDSVGACVIGDSVGGGVVGCGARDGDVVVVGYGVGDVGVGAVTIAPAWLVLACCRRLPTILALNGAIQSEDGGKGMVLESFWHHLGSL